MRSAKGRACPLAPMMNRGNQLASGFHQPEKLSGVLTLIAMLLAFAMVNSPLRSLYDLVHHTPVAFRVGEWQVERPLILWINEGLMVFFFLLVALEIKRETLQGHLASRAKVALPVIATERGLRPWVALGIVPVFAFFNAGVQIVELTPGALSASIAGGTAAALVFGKPIGILCASWAAVRMGVAKLPSGSNWIHVSGASLLAGIGFTMSLFFTGLAFGTRETMAISTTVGILIGSLMSAVLGVSLLAMTAGRAGQHEAKSATRLADAP